MIKIINLCSKVEQVIPCFHFDLEVIRLTQHVQQATSRLPENRNNINKLKILIILTNVVFPLKKYSYTFVYIQTDENTHFKART